LFEIQPNVIQLDKINPLEQSWGTILRDQFARVETMEYANDAAA
jgi:hypothetical protein